MSSIFDVIDLSGLSIFSCREVFFFFFLVDLSGLSSQGRRSFLSHLNKKSQYFSIFCIICAVLFELTCPSWKHAPPGWPQYTQVCKQEQGSSIGSTIHLPQPSCCSVIIIINVTASAEIKEPSDTKLREGWSLYRQILHINMFYVCIASFMSLLLVLMWPFLLMRFKAPVRSF